MKVNIINMMNHTLNDIELDEKIFGLSIRADILHRVIEWQKAKKRSGTHKTKTISEISGTTKKPYKQKGTGSARQGSLRSPQFRGGAVIFGPVVRSHEYSLNKKFRKLGLKIALSSKLAEGKLNIIDEIKSDSHKCKEAKKVFTNFNFKSILIVSGNDIDNNFSKSIANLHNINILPSIGANVFDIIRHDHLFLTIEAVKQLEERLK